MMASTRFMVEELRREREQSSLNVEELTHFIDGSEFITEKKRRICKCTRTILVVCKPSWKEGII